VRGSQATTTPHCAECCAAFSECAWTIRRNSFWLTPYMDPHLYCCCFQSNIIFEFNFKTNSWHNIEMKSLLVRILCNVFTFVSCTFNHGRSQWPCGLRHELSSLARTLRSWVRIPLKAWVSILCAFIMHLRYSAFRYRPCEGLDPPFNESYRLYI
jgi:ABC-type xylose transport system permease subunit